MPMILEYEYTTTGKEMVRQFEAQYGSLERLRKKVAAQHRRSRRVTKEWADLEWWEHHANRPDLLKGRMHVLRAGVFHDADAFLRILTPGRLRLLDALRAPDARYESVHELARALGRDPKNVLQDCKALAEHGLVTLDKRNARRTVPRAAVGRVVITM